MKYLTYIIKMKDTDYLKIVKKLEPEYTIILKYAVSNIFQYSNNINSINDAITKPDDLWNALSIYSSINNEKKYPPDTIAYSFAIIILNSQVLKKTKIGINFINKFDDYYIKAIKNTPTISEKTKKLYLKTIHRIKTEICNNESTLYTILQNPANFFEQLDIYCNNNKGRIIVNGEKQSLGQHTKDNITSALLALFIHNEEFRNNHFSIYQKWIEFQKEIRKPIKDKYLTNQPTDRQASGYFSYDDVIKVRNQLEDGSPERLLLTMYTEIPPVRSDYYDTEICTKDSSNNCDLSNKNYITLLKTKGTLILNKYKTSKNYGQQQINLPTEIIRQIKISLKKYPRKYLFVSNRFKDENKLPKPYCKLKNPANTFNTWANKTLKRLFNNDYISLTMLRHVYISRRDLKIEQLSGTERQKIATLMQHGVDQQSKYLWHAWLEENNKK